MIYKGSPKKMIKIKNPGSKYFEEAYFILKEDFCENEPEIKDMVEEANRIITESLRTKKKRRPKLKHAVIALSGATVCSIILSVVLFIIK